MLHRTALILSIALLVSGCARLAESRINPLNWFGNSQEQSTAAPAEIPPLTPPNRIVVVGDARPMIATVADMAVERIPGGAIVRATGIAATQGSFNAQLVTAGIENGTLILQFRVELPEGVHGIGTDASREVVVAQNFTDQDLAGSRSIRVVAAQNARVSRR
jgi:hypothetical protein